MEEIQLLRVGAKCKERLINAEIKGESTSAIPLEMEKHRPDVMSSLGSIEDGKKTG